MKGYLQWPHPKTHRMRLAIYSLNPVVEFGPRLTIIHSSHWPTQVCPTPNSVRWDSSSCRAHGRNQHTDKPRHAVCSSDPHLYAVHAMRVKTGEISDRKKLKTRPNMFRRNGPVRSRWSESWKKKSVYGGKDLWNRKVLSPVWKSECHADWLIISDWLTK